MFLVLFFSTGCQKVFDTSHQFRVGMECAYAPFNWTQYTDANGAVRIEGGGEFAGGYDVEVAKILAEKMGKELVIVKNDWDGLLPALTSGKIDAILAGMTATEVRRHTIDFTHPYYTSDIVVVVAKDGKYANAKSILDFSGARITGQLATVHYGIIDQMKGVIKFPAKEDFASMVIGVSSGEIDGYISEFPGATSAVYTNSHLTYVEFKESNGFNLTEEERSISIGLKKNDPLKYEIDKILSAISSEQRDNLMEKAIKQQPLASIT